MNRNGGGDTERKARIGTQPAFAVRLRQPPDGAAIVVEFDPDSVVLAAPESMALAAVRSDDSVDGLDAHRVTLTNAGGITAAGRLGVPGSDFGAAFLITSDADFIPITVLNIQSDRIILADPLPHGVEVSPALPAVIRYAVHTGIMPAAVTASATGGTPIPWVCDYTADLGADLAIHAAQQERGVLHVRRRIFDTGLDHHEFVGMMRGIVTLDAVFGNQADWTPQIDAARLALVIWIRGAIDSLGADREDSIDGGAFKLAHAYWSASLIERDIEAREALRDDAMKQARAAAESLIETDPDTQTPEIRDHGKRGSLMAAASTPRAATDTAGRYYIGRPF